MDKHIETMSRAAEMTAAPMTSQIFGNAGQEHMKKYGKNLISCLLMLFLVVLYGQVKDNCTLQLLEMFVNERERC